MATRTRRGVITVACLAVTLLAGGVRIAHAQTEVIEYYATDSVGSIRVVFDPSGTVKARSDYLPFGEEWQASGNLPTQRFTGQQRDTEEDLDYFNARSYQPRTGRFTTVDPVFAGLFQPQAWNRYAYALNSPLVYTDPTGLQAQACAGPTKVMNPDGTVISSSGGVGNCKDIPADGGSITMAIWFMMRELFLGVARAPGRGDIPSGEMPKGADLFKPDVILPYSGAPDGGPYGNAIPTGEAIADALALGGAVGQGKKVVATTVAKKAIASGPWGRRGSPLQNSPDQKTRNTATAIGGRNFSGHALDQMQNRGIPPTVVEGAIQNNRPISSGDNFLYRDPVNNLTVVTSPTGDVVTIGHGAFNPKPRP